MPYEVVESRLFVYNQGIMSAGGMTEHTSARFESTLNGLHSMALKMGGVVEEKVTFSVNVLRTRDIEKAKLVAKSDYQVNRLELQIDEACTHILALRSPLARDLRMVLAILKAITDLERIGDEAQRISKQVLEIGKAEIPPGIQQDLNYIGEQTTDMLRKALDGFARIRPAVHDELQHQDHLVDDRCNAVIEAFKLAAAEPETDIRLLLSALWCARSLERIGDHAKNIAEYVVYFAEGKDVRHHPSAGLSTSVA